MTVTVVGIELSQQEAAYRPKKSITTDIQSIASLTAGKLFIGVDVPNDGTTFALQMRFDDHPVEIVQNEKGFGGSTIHDSPAPFKAYAIDLPMRLVTVQKKPHTIQFFVGVYEGEVFREGTRSDVFELNIPSATPSVKYDQKKDGD
jgi:hypothetical protein